MNYIVVENPLELNYSCFLPFIFSITNIAI